MRRWLPLLLLRLGERRRRFDGDVSTSGIWTEIRREDVVPIREIKAESITAAAAADSTTRGSGGRGRRSAGAARGRGGGGIERRSRGEAADGGEERAREVWGLGIIGAGVRRLGLLVQRWSLGLPRALAGDRLTVAPLHVCECQRERERNKADSEGEYSQIVG